VDTDTAALLAQAEAHVREGRSLYDEGDFTGADRLLQVALEIREEALPADDPLVARTLSFLASILRRQGDYPGAAEFFERAIAIEEAGFGAGHPETLHTLNNFAVLLSTTGDYAGSAALLHRVVSIREGELGLDSPELVPTLSSLAFVLQKQGDFDTARDLYDRSLAILNDAGPETPFLAMTLNNYAMLLETQGDFAGARPMYERSLATREQNLGPRHPDFAQSLNNLAGLLMKQGDHDGARRLYERSLDIFEATLGPEHRATAVSLNNLARSLTLRREYDLAHPLYERSLAIYEAALGPTHPDITAGLNNLAHLLAIRGEYGEARELYKRSLTILEEAHGPSSFQLVPVLTNLGLLYEALGDLAEARAHLQRSLAISESALGEDHPHLSGTLLNIADVVHAQDPQSAEAKRFYERSLAVAEAQLDLIAVLSEREALLFMSTTRQSLDGWLGAFDAPSESEVAWSTAMRWKGLATRRVRDRTIDRHASSNAVEALQSRLRNTRAELARLTFADYRASGDVHRERQLELTAEKEALERELARESSQWRSQQQIEEATARDLCATLPEGGAIADFLSYSNGERSYVAFAVVAPECVVRRVELGPAAPIEKAVSEWLVVLADTDGQTSRVDRRGAVVRERVWDPLQGALAGAERIHIVPDGALTALPFAALPLDEYTYLLEKYPVHYLESAQDLLRESAVHLGSGALLVGDVDFGSRAANASQERLVASRSAACAGGNYASLEGTAGEVEALAKSWAKSAHRSEPSTILTGIDASESAVYAEMSGKRVVHLATHGFFASDKCKSALAGGAERGQSVVGFNPMLLSGIVLAGANAGHDPLDDYDGFLTAEELSAIDLRGTQLVVLSACETGLGVVRAGEGVLGLRRAFAAAGVEQLVMSLWSVPDEATSQLMADFYEGVLHRRRPMEAGDALREAQLEMLERNRDKLLDARPGSWAAFVVAGRP